MDVGGPETVSSPAATPEEEPLGHSVAAATWSLFVGLTLLLIAAGLAGSLVGVRAEREAFSSAAIGLISAAYYGGFLAGSKLAFWVLATVGHIRVFAALAALASGSVLLHTVMVNPVMWAIARSITGLAMAGLYVVAESWLNGLATNETRGRLLAVYMVVTSAAFGVGQALLTFSSASRVSGFVLGSILTSMAVMPVALSESSLPPLTKPMSMSFRELAKMVPTGVGASLLVGLAHGALLGMIAYYGAVEGLKPSAIAIFAALPTIGGVIFQWPISAASDDLDRRAVGIAVAFVAAVAAIAGAYVDVGGATAMILVCLVGGMSYPLYSIAGAYTNDWVPVDLQSAAASQLITAYGVGAFVGPLICGALMGSVGPVAWWWVVGGIHAALAVFFFYRFLAWRSPLTRVPWDQVNAPARAFFIPATTMSAGLRLTRRIKAAARPQP